MATTKLLEDPPNHEMSCPICFEEYDIQDIQRTPKLLLCLHTFCLECIARVSRADHSLECPMCRMLHQQVHTDNLFDNLVILQHLRRECEMRDLQLAQQMDKEMRHQLGQPSAASLRAREQQQAAIAPGNIVQPQPPVHGDGNAAAVEERLEERRNEDMEDQEAAVIFDSDGDDTEASHNSSEHEAGESAEERDGSEHEEDDSVSFVGLLGEWEASADFQEMSELGDDAAEVLNEHINCSQEAVPIVIESDGSADGGNEIDQDGSSSEIFADMMQDGSDNQSSEEEHSHDRSPDLRFCVRMPRVHFPFPVVDNPADDDARDATIVLDDSDADIESFEFGVCTRMTLRSGDNNQSCQGCHSSSNSDHLNTDGERESGEGQQPATCIVLSDNVGDEGDDEEEEEEEDHFHSAVEDFLCRTLSIEADDDAQNASEWDF